ncbi:MAG TPA: hypothetical protein VIB60_01185 [Methylomirabilota bacterium]|jgi:hypothetical protein
MHRHIRSIIAAGVTTTLLAAATAALAGPSGAIFTTNEQGSWVNGNVYPSKEAVYLNGGPRVNQNCTAAGLPDGHYYFQVTDPSGKALLSADALGQRRILVSMGVITEYLGTTHAINSPPPERCGGVTVSLVGVADPPSLLDTPNPGGEYKVWLTPVPEDDHTCDALVACAGRFQPSNSKTDNFKVQPPDEPDGDGDGD